MPIIQVNISGQSLQLGIDSGAGINLLSESLKHQLTLSLTGGGNVTGMNSKNENLEMAEIEAIKVGILSCQPMRTMFVPIEQFNKNSGRVDIDGILGYEFLSQFRIAINFYQKEIYLWDKETMEAQLAMRNKMDVKR